MKVLSYVYICTNRENKSFYIGFRRANKVPAIEDLGIHYFTSFDIIKYNFGLYDYEILGEYEDPKYAWKVEQYLIWHMRKNTKCLNRAKGINYQL